jgi:hypothetical protein
VRYADAVVERPGKGSHPTQRGVCVGTQHLEEVAHHFGPLQ